MSSNVIKARTLDAMGGSAVIKRSVQIACQDASAIVADAQNQAQAIISGARRTAESMFESARESGYQTGTGQWNDALAQAWQARDEYIAGNETALLRLSVRIAEKLIGEELRTAPDAIVGIVREALRSARRAKGLIIQVHPTATGLVNERLSTLNIPPASAREVEVVANTSLAQSDCIVESDIGVIDARLETQLKNMERILTLKMSV